MDNSIVWSVQNLNVNYEENAVLCGISFNIHAGRLVAVVGPNGAGKSTLFKASLGIFKSCGDILFFGKRFKEVRSRIAYMPQRVSIDWDFPITVLDLVLMGTYSTKRFFQRVSSRDKEDALKILDRVGLKGMAGRQISQLSGGQQQRAFLARALMQKADLYLMDEMFAAIDTVSCEAISAILQELIKEGKTVVVIHHDLKQIENLFDDVIILNKRLVCCGPVKTYFKSKFLDIAYNMETTVLEQTLDVLRKSSSGCGDSK